VKLVDPAHRDMGVIFNEEIVKPLGVGMVYDLIIFVISTHC
jgi:hypothetical protein